MTVVLFGGIVDFYYNGKMRDWQSINPDYYHATVQ